MPLKRKNKWNPEKNGCFSGFFGKKALFFKKKRKKPCLFARYEVLYRIR